MTVIIVAPATVDGLSPDARRWPAAHLRGPLRCAEEIQLLYLSAMDVDLLVVAKEKAPLAARSAMGLAVAKWPFLSQGPRGRTGLN